MRLEMGNQSRSIVAASHRRRRRTTRLDSTHTTLDLTANECGKTLDIVCRVIGIHLIRRISAHKVENGEFPTGVLVCPSSEVEYLILIDDEMISRDDALLERCARYEGRTTARGRRGRRCVAKPSLLDVRESAGSARVRHGCWEGS